MTDTIIRPCPKCRLEGEADRGETRLECPHCGYVWTVRPAEPPQSWLKPKVAPSSYPKLRSGFAEVEVKLPGGHGPNHALKEGLDHVRRMVYMTWLMILTLAIVDYFSR